MLLPGHFKIREQGKGRIGTPNFLLLCQMQRLMGNEFYFSDKTDVTGLRIVSS